MSVNESEYFGGEPPSHRTSDYVEIGLLSALILAGTPLNLVVLIKTVAVVTSAKRQKRCTRSSRVISRLTLFKLHLTLANLMVLSIYAISQISWLVGKNLLSLASILGKQDDPGPH